MSRSPQLDPGAAKSLLIADTWPEIEIEQMTPAWARAAMERQHVLWGPVEEVAEVRDLALERADGSELRLRLFRSNRSGRLPAIVFIHGGGWVVGTLENYDACCRMLANAAGAAVVAVDYRLAPEYPYPCGLEDCLLAAAWVERNLETLGAAPEGIAVMGDSAGGNLTAAVCLARRERQEQQPLAQILAYPALDPHCNSRSHRQTGEGYFITSAAIRWFWHQYVSEGGALEAPLVAPARARSLAGLAPALIVTAGFDPLCDEGEAYGERLRQAGVEVSVKRFDRQIHGFLTWSKYIADSREGFAAIASWLREPRKQRRA